MIRIIDKTNLKTSADELNKVFRLRHAIFVEESGWEALRRPDGLERDQYDDEHAIHMLLHEHGELIGYQRMLPTMRPYLLSEIYPQLCDDEPPSSLHIYEWTRFAVIPDRRGDGRSLGLAGARLVQAFVEWGLNSGVDAVVVELAPNQMLKFAQCHFRAHPLGIIQDINGQDTIAVLARFDERKRDRLAQVVRGLTIRQASSQFAGSGFEEVA